MLKKKNRHLISPQFFESRSFKKLGTVPGEHGLFLIMRKFVHAYETSLCSFAQGQKKKKGNQQELLFAFDNNQPFSLCTLQKGMHTQERKLQTKYFLQ